MKYKVGFCDFEKGFNKYDNFWLSVLKEMYGGDAIEVSDNPDYLFFSCFGYQHLKYRCVKIFFTGENIVPDFNLCDYAIGFHEISFDDRYLRLPLYHLYKRAYKLAIVKHLNEEALLLNRDFCCSVISNSLGDGKRKRIIDLLEDYKFVAHGGRYRNNVGGRVADKLEFEKGYKFTICFENSRTIGYTTEKLLEGFAGGGIPIYWGNPHITKEFNVKAFINCADFSSLEEVVEFVREVNENDEIYMQMVREPIFVGESEGKEEYLHQKCMDFLKHIFEQDVADAYRKNELGVGETYIERHRRFRVWFQLDRFLQRVKLFVKNRWIIFRS